MGEENTAGTKNTGTAWILLNELFFDKWMEKITGISASDIWKSHFFDPEIVRKPFKYGVSGRVCCDLMPKRTDKQSNFYYS